MSRGSFFRFFKFDPEVEISGDLYQNSDLDYGPSFSKRYNFFHRRANDLKLPGHIGIMNINNNHLTLQLQILPIGAESSNSAVFTLFRVLTLIEMISVHNLCVKVSCS